MSVPLYVHSDLPQYQIEEILARKNTKNGVMYLIKWRGFQVDESTWEPVINLFDSLDMVRQFEKKHHGQQNDLNSSDELHQGENVADPGRKNKRIFKEHLIFGKHKKMRIKNQIKVLKHEKFPKCSSLQERLIPSLLGGMEINSNQNNFSSVDSQKNSLNNQSQQKINHLKALDFGCEQFCVVIQEIHPKPQTDQNLNELKKQQRQTQPSHFEYNNEVRPVIKQPSIQRRQPKKDNYQNYQNINGGERKTETSLIDNIKIFNIYGDQRDLKILKQNDPALKSENIEIKGIVNCEGCWFAQIGNGQEVVGYICMNELKGMKKSDLQFLTRYMQIKEKEKEKEN